MIRELSRNEVSALHYELVMKDIVTAAEKLPPFPDVAWKLTSMIKKMAPISQMESVISVDQTLAATVLRLSRSAFYARRGEVRSLKDAIMLLGNKRLLQVILSACALRYFEKGGADQAETELWEHSVASAIVSEIVSRHLSKGRVLTLYTAALLHDIGKTILNVYARIYLQSNLYKMRSEGKSVQIERMALGIDHQELGGVIARNWKFPSDITAAICHHHDPEKAGPYWDIASIVHVSSKLATASANQAQPGPKRQQLDVEQDKVFKILGITAKMAQDIMEELAEQMSGVKNMLNS